MSTVRTALWFMRVDQQILRGIIFFQFVAQQGFQVRNQERVIFTGKADAGASGSGPSGSADSVDVVVRVFRQIVIDYMADAVNVNAASGNVGGDQYRNLA